MVEQIYKNPDIYKIHIPLPDNPLKNLNSYVVMTSERSLIIDTGFNRPECLEAFNSGLAELGVDINNADIFLTHFHSDHIGLVPSVIGEDTGVYMSRCDKGFMNWYLAGDYWEIVEGKLTREGFPEGEVISQRSTNPARIFSPKTVFDVKCVDDGHIIQLGNLSFTCIETPGHTPGHMCLYLEREGLIFLGDHILFDITPNITAWYGVENSLKDYLQSLKKIDGLEREGLEIKTALPGHRGQSLPVHERIKEIMLHHEYRLADTIEIVERNPGLTAYEIASKMKWNMRNKGWDEFPINQKWFAVGETIAHLDYLEKEKKINKLWNDNKGVFEYENNKR